LIVGIFSDAQAGEVQKDLLIGQKNDFPSHNFPKLAIGSHVLLRR
jgi:hypothetical protein